MVSFVRDHWHLFTAIVFGFIHCPLQVQFFYRLDLKVQERQIITDHIRCIRMTRILSASTGSFKAFVPAMFGP